MLHSIKRTEFGTTVVTVVVTSLVTGECLHTIVRNDKNHNLCKQVYPMHGCGTEREES